MPNLPLNLETNINKAYVVHESNTEYISRYTYSQSKTATDGQVIKPVVNDNCVLLEYNNKPIPLERYINGTKNPYYKKMTIDEMTKYTELEYTRYRDGNYNGRLVSYKAKCKLDIRLSQDKRSVGVYETTYLSDGSEHVNEVVTIRRVGAEPIKDYNSDEYCFVLDYQYLSLKSSSVGYGGSGKIYQPIVTDDTIDIGLTCSIRGCELTSDGVWSHNDYDSRPIKILISTEPIKRTVIKSKVIQRTERSVLS